RRSIFCLIHITGEIGSVLQFVLDLRPYICMNGGQTNSRHMWFWTKISRTTPFDRVGLRTIKEVQGMLFGPSDICGIKWATRVLEVKFFLLWSADHVGTLAFSI
ncbi:hypothetical protein ACJX0J_015083, partial [Zea mays]